MSVQPVVPKISKHGFRGFVGQFQELFPRFYPEFGAHNQTDNIRVKNFTIVPTFDCQLLCDYCYQGAKCNKVMSKETAKKAVDMLFEEDAKGGYVNKHNSQAIILDFIGGEPLLEIDLIDYIVEYFRYKALTLKHPWALHHMVSIGTNGILYKDKKVQDFINRNAGRLSIAITIDGNKELHDSCRKFPDGSGSYDIVEDAVRDYVKRYQEPNTKLTIAPQNMSYLTEAIKNLAFLGMTHVNANVVFEDVWEPHHAVEYYIELKRLADYLLTETTPYDFYCSLFDENIGEALPETENNNWCGGTGVMLGVDPDGLLYPCLRYMPHSLGDSAEPYVIGDVDNGIGCSELYKERIDCMTCVTRRSQSTDECFECPINQGCAWCSAYNYQVFGTVNKRTTFICEMHKARVLANVYYWNKLYAKYGFEDKYKCNVPRDWSLKIVSEEEYNMLIELQND